MSLRASILAALALAALALPALALPPSALAAATAGLNLTPVPIPGFRNTGPLLGGGTALKVLLSITGTESDGAPSSLSELSLALPPGTRVTATGLPTCPVSRLSSRGPVGCQAGSQAGPIGLDRIAGISEQEFLKEEGTAQAFYGPRSALDLYLANPFPLSKAIIATGAFSAPGALGGPELHIVFPPVPAMLGAPDLSLEGLHFTFGTAHRRSKHRVASYYLTLPRTCPPEGWTYQSSIILQSTQVLTASRLIPCPTRSAPRPPHHSKHPHSHGRGGGGGGGGGGGAGARGKHRPG